MHIRDATLTEKHFKSFFTNVDTVMGHGRTEIAIAEQLIRNVT